MDLYISTKDNLYFNPFYPNTSATLYDISFLFFFLLSIKKKKKKNLLPPSGSLDSHYPRGFVGMQTHCNCWQAAVRLRVQQKPKR